MPFIIESKAVVLKEDDVSTDQIWPGRYVNISDPAEMAEHVLEGADKTLKTRFRTVGAILVTGNNFGCGSSREQAVLSLLMAGVKAVVAGSAARIWYRNAVNLGLPVLFCAGAVDRVREGDAIAIDLAAGTLALANGEVLQGEPVGEFILNILSSGGIKPLMRKKHAQDG